MAFTTTQAAQIRQFLGYSSLFRYLNTRLESAIEIAGADASSKTLVETALTNLASIDTQITTLGLSTAGVKKVDEVEFFERGKVAELQRLGRMWVGRISMVLGVPPYGDVFGADGYPGDTFTADSAIAGRSGSSRGGMFGVG